MIGRHLSHFYVIRAIGAGGMGVVYEAQDTRLPRSVAIKVLKDDVAKNVDAIRRFKREARLASSLNHPNICTILDVNDSTSQAFIAMELLEGESLKARLRRAPLSSGEIVDIIRQIVDALAAAHEHGIIHRDITPGNVYLTSSGLVKLLDFGLAIQVADAAGDEPEDGGGADTTAGTIHYMAPEQFSDNAVTDHRADLYALGAVIYQMATGAPPVAADRPMCERAPQHPVQLGRIVDRLLQKDPDDRYQSAAALRADIDALVSGLSGDVPTPAPVGGYSAVPEAYHALKRGRQFWASCHEGGWRPALEQFQQAVDLDPQFARAHVAIANANNFLGFYSIQKPAVVFARASQAAERAISIDSRLGPAFIELGLAKLGGEWDWDGAEAAFRRGLALEPADAMAHIHYSWLLILLGREDAALAEAQRGLALAPSSRLVSTGRAQTLFLAGKYDEATRACDECLRFDPAYVFAIHLRGLCNLATGKGAAAISDLERAVALTGSAAFYLGLLGRCYAEHGRQEQARAVLALLNRRSDTYVPPQCYVFVYAALGERERALEYQEMAYAHGASPFNYLFPGIRELYARSPDHKKRLEQMRLIL